MSIGKWQEITDGIDEKYADECAEYLAKHANAAEPVDGGTPTEIKISQPQKNRIRSWIIGVAAAVVICICTAAGLILSRGDVLLPHDTPTEEITSETTETDETAETVQTTDNVIIPEFKADETMWVLSPLNAYDLQGLDDYGLPDDLDVTTLPDFAYVEEHLATLTEQEQAELATDNYSWNSYGWRYAGNGAWIIKYQYHLAVGGKTGSYFTQYLLVRDNTVERCIKEVYGNSYYDGEYGSNDGYYGNSLGDWGECLLYCHENGILAINTETFEAKDIITADSYCVIHFVTDNYIVYSEADGLMRVYRADIDGYYDTDCRFVSECSERYGAEVICRRNEQYYSFELATNKLTKLDMSTEQYNELTLRYDVQSEAYAASYINDEKRDDIADYAYNTIDNGKFELLYKKTGERLTVRLDGIRELLGKPETMTHELLGFCGDVLYLAINENDKGDESEPCCIAAIDVNTFNTAVMTFDGGYFSGFNSITGGVYHRFDSVVTALTLTADLGAIEDGWETDDVDYVLAPELIEDDSVWSTTTFSLSAIEEQVGYDTPVDITALPEYAEAVAHAETLEQSVRDELKAQNYSECSTNQCYVGSDNADWLCTASYTLVTGSLAYPYYTRLFVVKDNKVGETLLEVNGDIYSIIQRTDDVAIASDNGIYLYKRGDSAVTKLADISGGYSRLGQLNEKYILFYDGDSVLKVYVCDSGEVISTDIRMAIHDGTNYILDGDRIVYCDPMHSGPFRSFDIPTQQYNDTEITAALYEELCDKKLAIQNEHYAAESANDFDIIVRSLDDGSEQCYTFRELAADVKYDTRAINISPIGFDGKILIISAQALNDRLESCVIALDVETGEAYKLVTDSVVQRFVFNSFIGYSYRNNIDYAIQFLGAPLT